MTEPKPPSDRGGFLTRLSAPMLGAIGVVVFAGVGAGGYYAYQTYDYVQHDNDFCMSCHLMQQPYELFAKSAHRGLGCKACHQPNLVDRSTMALTQIIENPEVIAVHAEVPNERCAECHIRGDPEKWRQVANSAGHRVHLESDDPSLEGLRCVECHSTALHEFSPVDRTCAQSECHEDNVIKLGGMSDLTIHCAACHSFVAPVTVPGERRELLEAIILPDQEECLSCHVMRTLVEMPSPDPHRGICSSCHNPHEQDTPQQAVESCTSAGCHTGPDTLTAFHRGLPSGVLEGCLACHSAHDFKSEGMDCRSCHVGIESDSLGITLPFPTDPPAADTSGVASAAMAASDPRGAGRYVHRAGFVGVGMSLAVGHPSTAGPPQESPRFLHSEHRDIGCGNCHSNEERHGALTVRTLGDCRDCHHTEPVSRSCVRCHDASDAPIQALTVQRGVTLSVPGSGTRTLPFAHEVHEGLDCATCHTEGADRSAANADCMSCHEDHHDPASNCASCHRQAPVSAHPPAEGHVTCTGAGCHESTPFEGLPRTREVCLVCHQGLRDHRPDRACAECHTLPPPRRSGLEEHIP